MEKRLQLIENRLESIESKQDKILDEIVENKIINARNTASLEEHIARSNALEKEIRLVEQELRPIITHVAIMKFIGSVLVLSLGGGAIFKIAQAILWR